MDMNEAVAKAIGAERSIADMTVRELAAAAGIPERSLMRVLQADRDIKVKQVEQIAAAMKLYPHEIVERAEVILERSRREAPTLTIVPDVGGLSDDDLANLDLRQCEVDLVATTDTTTVSEQDHPDYENESQDHED